MDNLIADVKLSIELEKKGYDFYTETAEKTKNPLAVSTLKSLAKRELVHLERIKEFYKDLSGEEKLASDWLKGVSVPPSRQELLKPIVEKLKGSLKQQFESEEEINEAYVIAEGLERDSYNLYNKIAEGSQDETTKKFYSALAQEEIEHFEILEETLKYLQTPGDWFKEQERWIVDGGGAAV